MAGIGFPPRPSGPGSGPVRLGCLTVWLREFAQDFSDDLLVDHVVGTR